MTPEEHYQRAERLLDMATTATGNFKVACVQMASAHAMLALYRPDDGTVDTTPQT